MAKGPPPVTWGFSPGEGVRRATHPPLPQNFGEIGIDGGENWAKALKKQGGSLEKNGREGLAHPERPLFSRPSPNCGLAFTAGRTTTRKAPPQKSNTNWISLIKSTYPSIYETAGKFG